MERTRERTLLARYTHTCAVPCFRNATSAKRGCSLENAVPYTITIKGGRRHKGKLSSPRLLFLRRIITGNNSRVNICTPGRKRFRNVPPYPGMIASHPTGLRIIFSIPFFPSFSVCHLPPLSEFLFRVRTIVIFTAGEVLKLQMDLFNFTNVSTRESLDSAKIGNKSISFNFIGEETSPHPRRTRVYILYNITSYVLV